MENAPKGSCEESEEFDPGFFFLQSTRFSMLTYSQIQMFAPSSLKTLGEQYALVSSGSALPMN